MWFYPNSCNAKAMYPVHISHMVDICLLKVESENHSFSLALICGLNELKVVLQPLKRSLSWGSKSMKMAHGFLSVTSMKSCSWTERGDATMHLFYKWIFRIPSWTHSKRQSVNTFGNPCLVQRKISWNATVAVALLLLHMCMPIQAFPCNPGTPTTCQGQQSTTSAPWIMASTTSP